MLGPTEISFTLRVHGLCHSSWPSCELWSFSSSSLLHRKYQRLFIRVSGAVLKPSSCQLRPDFLCKCSAIPLSHQLLFLWPATHSGAVHVHCCCWSKCSQGENISAPVILTLPPLFYTPALLKSFTWEAILLSPFLPWSLFLPFKAILLSLLFKVNRPD